MVPACAVAVWVVCRLTGARASGSCVVVTIDRSDDQTVSFPAELVNAHGLNVEAIVVDYF